MLTGAWSLLATPAASLIFSALAVVLLVRCGYHRDKDGAITRRRLASVVLLSAASYSFAICVLSQLVMSGPSVGTLIEDGFGSERAAWLLMGVTLDQALRLWDEYRPHK